MNVPWVRHLRRSPGVRSLNLFQGMPLVCTGCCVSLADLEGQASPPQGQARAAIAGYSRLISLASSCLADEADKMGGSYCCGVRKCIRVMARLCLTSRQACIAGSDLA